MARRVFPAMRRAYCTSTFGYCETSLKEPIPGGAPKRSPTGPSPAQASQTSNGMKVITKDNGGATALIGFYVDAGCMYENKGNAGTSHYVSEMLFKSNLLSSDYHMFKTFQNSAANYTTGQIGKKHLFMKVECRRDVVGELMKRMCEGMFAPRFAAHELSMVRERVENMAEVEDHSPREYTLSKLVETAFTGSPLANSPTCPAYNVDAITSEDLINWWASFFVPKRITLAGVNVTQEELLTAYEGAEWSSANADGPSHANPPLIPSPINQEAGYHGGVWTQFMRRTDKFPAQQHYNDVHVAFARRGMGHTSVQNYATMLVAAGILGGDLEGQLGSQGIYEGFSQTGLIGGLLRSRPNEAGEKVKALAAAVNSLGAKVDDATLAAAKNTATVQFLRSVATRNGLLDFLVSQSSESGLGKQPEDVVNAIRNVSAGDLKKAHDLMMSAPLSFAAYGDLSTVPSIQSI